MLGKVIDLLSQILQVLKEILHELYALRSDINDLKPVANPELESKDVSPYKDKNGMFNYKAYKYKKHDPDEVEE